MTERTDTTTQRLLLTPEEAAESLRISRTLVLRTDALAPTRVGPYRLLSSDTRRSGERLRPAAPPIAGVGRTGGAGTMAVAHLGPATRRRDRSRARERMSAPHA
jgi:hypothetical protein